MVAGGIPHARVDHTQAVARMALDMLQVLQQLTDPRFKTLNIRIGIHCGPVVAGVIGTSKFVYDLWGDTVNTASRMESHGAPGRIHVSRAAQEALQDAFVLEPRGTISVKGKGDMETFFLLSVKGAGA